MKKLILHTLILTCSITHLFAADALMLKSQDGPHLGQLLSAHSHIRKEAQFRKGGTATVATLGLYGLSKSGIAHSVLPELFPRSGTSTAIVWGIGAIATTGGLWVAADVYDTYKYNKDASSNIDQALRELKELSTVLAELKESKAHFAIQHVAMEKKVTEAQVNAKSARTSMENAELSIVTLVQNMKGDMKNAVHVKEVIALKTRVADMEALLQQISLTELQRATHTGPSFDTMVRQATELEEAARKFSKTDNHKAPKESADKTANESDRKKKWWRP
jgi:hypothetical protein